MNMGRHQRRILRSRHMLGLLCILLASGVGMAARAQTPPPPTDQLVDEAVPGRRAAWDRDPDADLASRAGQGDFAAAAASDCLGYKGSTDRQVEYTSDGVVHVAGCGAVWTLTEVYAALPETSPKYPAGQTKASYVLQPLPNNEWLLRKSLKVEEGARLNIVGGAGGDVSWLKLLSTDTAGVFLRAENGTLHIENTKVTSWDDGLNSVDTTYSVNDPSTPGNEGAGRSYLSARSLLTSGRETAAPTTCDVAGGSQEPYEARMDIINSEIGYLGYKAAESWGTSWKVNYKDPSNPGATLPGRSLYAIVDVFGSVVNSRIHNNYFGTYTFGGYCMRFTGSEYDHNVKYGLDPHDDTDYIVIDDNEFHHNGSHGVICSQYCDHIQITNNRSHDNVGVANNDESQVPYTHGIMIHRSVSDSLVANNQSYNNNGGGIAVFESFNNVIRDNEVRNNGQAALRLSVGAHSNLFENNTLEGPPAGSSTTGYVVYSYQGSDAPAVTDGVIRNNIFRNNTMRGYKEPTIRLGDATGNVFEGNTINGPGVNVELEATDNYRNAHGGTALINTFRTDNLGALRFELDELNSTYIDRTGLRARICYAGFANGAEAARGLSGMTGSFGFAFAGPSSEVVFDVSRASDCGYSTWLPMVVR